MGLRDRDLVPGKKKRTRGSMVFAVIGALFAGWLIRMGVHTYVWTPVVVSESAMEPSLKRGEVLTFERYFRPPDLQHDTMIWMLHPLNDKHRMIRRIVGVAGDRVELQKGTLLVNGKTIRSPSEQLKDSTEGTPEKDESANTPGQRQLRFFDRSEITLNQDEIYVVADGKGLDSRHFGPVPTVRVLGRLRQ